jgi:hypothetical protein
MIKTSNHLWNKPGFDKRDHADEAWHDIMPPLHDEFYHPFYHVYSSQIPDNNLFSENNGTIFLKDGVLSLLHFQARLLKNRHLIKNNFAIPLHMAYVVPKELSDFFIYYQNKTLPPSSSPSNNQALLFLAPLALHTNIEQLEVQLLSAKAKYHNLLIIRPALREESLQILINGHYDLLLYGQYIECIKRHFSLENIQVVTSDNLHDVNLLEYDYLNTNHYNFFCSEDFFSYFYCFKTGKTNSPLLNMEDFKLIKNEKLVKDLSINLFYFQGISLINDNDLATIKTIQNTERYFIDSNKKSNDRFQFYEPDLTALASVASTKLFKLLTGNIT